MKEKTIKKNNVYRNALELVAIGGITGVFVGAVVSIYNVFASKGEEISHEFYSFVRANPAFIPLLLLTLVLGAFFLTVFTFLAPEVKGCGIPQAEGASRGVIRLHWFRDAAAMFAASLVGIFMGLSVGNEGPSVQIGASVGDGVARGLRRNEMIRRYQVTGGACAGLAVASNAPLTGMAFAFEEAHKRFTPEVFICAFSSVIFGMFTREAVFSALRIPSKSAFGSYVFAELPLRYYPYVALSALVCGLLGVAFYKAVFFVRKRYRGFRLAPKTANKKSNKTATETVTETAPQTTEITENDVKNKRTTAFLKILSAVLAGGLLSFLVTGAMGGGHELIESLGSLNDGSVEFGTIIPMPLVVTLLTVFAFKLIATCLNLGAGIPCGIFLPIIAMGACLGGVLNVAWQALGMEAIYADLMIMICMATFFTTVVKAPITGIIMVCEFTWSFAPLLPLILGVSIGYIIGDVSRTNGIYDEILEEYEEETGVREREQRVKFTVRVCANSVADKREIRDVLWPSGARVTEIFRAGNALLPDGGTILKSGDELTVVCRTLNPDKAKEELLHLTGADALN